MEDKTTELFSSYPENRYQRGDRAVKALESYDDAQNVWDRDTTIAEAERRHKESERWDAVVTVGEHIASLVNSRSVEELAKGLYVGLSRQHRTLQAQSIAALIKLLGIYRDADYDLRNRAAVIAAERISQLVDDEHIGIPLI